jgi:Tol biopolymer transport system component
MASDIYVMDANGDNLRNVTRHPSDDSSPAWGLLSRD